MSDQDVAFRALVGLLQGLATYNDKGYMWCHHDEAERAAQRARARDGIEELIERLQRQEPLPPDLLALLRSKELLESPSSDPHVTRLETWWQQREP